MDQIKKILNQNLMDSIAAKQEFRKQEDQIYLFAESVKTIVQCYKEGGRLYIAGNGGSAADAQHLAAELVCRLSKDRAPIAAEALTVDSSILTSIGNDYGYDKVFSRQIIGKATKKDIFLAISTSGNSENIIKALEACREIGIKSVLLSGGSGGLAKSISDFCILASANRTSTIQEMHILLVHTLCECIEKEIGNFII